MASVRVISHARQEAFARRGRKKGKGELGGGHGQTLEPAPFLDKPYFPFPLLQKTHTSLYTGCQSISHWFGPSDVIAFSTLPGLG